MDTLSPKELARITDGMTVLELYGRVGNGLAMAASEVGKLKYWLQQRRAKLLAEVEEIDEVLKTASKHTDGWYAQIRAEGDFLRNKQ